MCLIGGKLQNFWYLSKGGFDLAGFCVGIVEKENFANGKTKAGDLLIGLPSNEYMQMVSLINKLLVKKNIAIKKNI